MNHDQRNPLSAYNVCRALIKNGLITKLQAKTILDKKEKFKIEIEKLRELDQPSVGTGIKIINPITIIDIISMLKVRRADDRTNILDEEMIYQAMAQEWGYDYRKIDPLKLDLNLVTTTIPRNFAMKHLIMPVAINNSSLTVATPNPFNVEIIEDIARACKLNVHPVVSSKSDIIKLIDEFFGFKTSIAAAETQYNEPTVDIGNFEQYVRLKAMDELPSNDQHIVNAVNHLFSYAFDQRASDVHIEPKREESLVRLRIDGVLHTVYTLPKNVHSAVISRIKNLSRMDMAEKRRPQDGRIKTDKRGVEVEIRVSTIPVAFGEKVVMRIMEPDILFQDRSKLGFSATDLTHFNKFIGMPHGIVLVCGPTGSGKSTTLYSTLRSLSSTEVNITTVEDPIEMVHEAFNQISVQPAINITFSTILRNILRQDPDIIMIGEMRDYETAQNAIQAALTGHLVLSTLHTNDAAAAITRLLDLGVPSFLIQSSLIGVISQRLVRKVCTYCRTSFEMTRMDLAKIGLKLPKKTKDPVILWKGKGCQRCRFTGFLGRTGIFEVLRYSDKLKKLTTAETDVETIRVQARKEGLTTLRENAVVKLLKGITTYQEVMRATWEND